MGQNYVLLFIMVMTPDQKKKFLKILKMMKKNKIAKSLNVFVQCICVKARF